MRPFKFASLFALVATASLAIVIGSGSASARASQALEVTRNDVTAAMQDERTALAIPVAGEGIKKRIQCKRCSCYNSDCKEACRSCQPHPKAAVLKRVDVSEAKQDEVQTLAIRAAATAEIQERVCRRCDCANADCYYSCRNCQPPKKSIVLERDDVTKGTQNEDKAFAMRAMISPDEAPNTIFASRGPNVGLTAEVAARTVWDDIPSQGGDFARDEHHALTPRAVLIKKTAHDGKAGHANPRAEPSKGKADVKARTLAHDFRASAAPRDGDQEH